MLNLVSILIGAVALFFGVFAFLPLLGWGYWFIIPVAIVGAIVGQLSSKNTGRNFNLIVIAVGVIRLSLGGGFI